MAGQDTVYIVDDDAAVRDSLSWLLESIDLSVACFASADALLSAFDPECVGCVLVDIRLPGMSGLELQQRLATLYPDVPVIIITGHGDVPAAVRAMKAGAVDFVEKPFSDHHLIDCIQRALAQHERWQEHHSVCETIRSRLERLTPRERQVLDRVVAGQLNKQIAADLGLSHKTVEVHRAHVMKKMEAPSLAQLVRMTVVANDKLQDEIQRVAVTHDVA